MLKSTTMLTRGESALKKKNLTLGQGGFKSARVEVEYEEDETDDYERQVALEREKVLSAMDFNF